MEGIKVKHVSVARNNPGEIHGAPYDVREIRAYIRRRIKANMLINPRNRRKPGM